MKEPKLLVGSRFGVYIPQTFIEMYGDSVDNKKELAEELEICSRDPRVMDDTDYYWECWDIILSEATIDGSVLVHDEDLWLMDPEEADNWEYI